MNHTGRRKNNEGKARKSLYAVSAFIATLSLSAPGYAQFINYGSLQTMFGEPITTSATGTPQRASEVAANMTIITADEIRQSGSRNIPDILSRVPGLDILHTGINVFDVGVRGYQEPMQPRLLVLIDGRQVFIDDFSRTVWENLPVNIDDIRQIEVVKGPATALFGTNAAGGVINIVTYSPLYDKNNVAFAGIGTQKEYVGDFTTTLHADWGGTKISAGGLNVDEFTTKQNPHEVEGILTPYHRYITDSTVVKVTPGLLFNGEATYSESIGNASDPTSGFIMAGQHTTTYSFRGGATWDSPIGRLSTDNYLNHSDYSIKEGDFYVNIMTLLSNQIQDEFRVGLDHTFRITLEQRYKTFRDGAISYNAFGQFSLPPYPVRYETGETTDSIGGTWLWTINDKITFTNSLRGDRRQTSNLGALVPGTVFSDADYSHVNGVWSANSSLNYKITDVDSVRAGYGRGIQQPSFIESSDNLVQVFPVAFYLDLEGNPKLKPTVVEEYDLDYTRKLLNLFSEAKFSLFYETNTDITAAYWATKFSPVGMFGNRTLAAYAVNVGDSWGAGGEIQVKGAHDGFRWDASYSLASLKDQTRVQQSINYQGSAPEHHFRLLGGYTFHNWEVDANAQYVTSTEMLRSGYVVRPTDGYSSLAGRIGYNISDNFTLALSGTNLSHRITDASPYPALERQVLLGITGRF